LILPELVVIMSTAHSALSNWYRAQAAVGHQRASVDMSRGNRCQPFATVVSCASRSSMRREGRERTFAADNDAKSQENNVKQTFRFAGAWTCHNPSLADSNTSFLISAVE